MLYQTAADIEPDLGPGINFVWIVVVVGAGSKDIGISGIYSEDTAVSLDMSTTA